ncbi:MAG: hypothetical protein ACRD18_15575 [Terriglobia bacterium]
MKTETNHRTKHVAVRVSQQAYDRLRSLAESEQKPLREWCRDRLLEVLKGPSVTPADHAVLAEIAATQDIVVGLVCALGREGRLTPQKAQEIVDAAHNRKYRDVAALLKYAHSRTHTGKAVKRHTSDSDGELTDES